MINKINRFSIAITKYDYIEFTDADMKHDGYEGVITDEMRREYLNNLIEEKESEYGKYDDIEIEEMN